MDYYSMSDLAIEKELGSRFRALRLNKNITQQELANSTCTSLNTIKALEQGKAKISTVIAVLRELNALQELDGFIAPPQISPLQLAKLKGKERERARAINKDIKDEAEW